MLRSILIIAAGGFVGKYRGGIFHNRDEIVGRIKNKILHKIVYFMVQGDVVNALFTASLASHVKGWHIFPLMFLMSMRGSTPGWGEYIGAAGGWRPTITKPLEPEVPYIDKIAHSITKNTRLWGVIALSLRCGEWGLFLSAPLLSFWPMLAGLAAGPIVFLLSRIISQKYVWPVFEILLGALFAAAIWNT